MKKFIYLLLFLGLFIPVYSIQTEEIREIIKKNIATQGDAVYLVACVKNPALKRTDVKGGDSEEHLYYGNLAAVILEQTGTSGIWLYQLTHFSRYAFLSAVEKGWMTADYSDNRGVSGVELLAVIGRLKSDLDSNKELSGGNK